DSGCAKLFPPSRPLSPPAVFSGAQLMQQRQLRLGDILDDYCPRERRVTNHAVVAMLGEDIKQTRCTTCDAEHEYKHAKIPRQRRKQDTPAALYTQVLSGGPKRVAHESDAEESENVPQAPPAESMAAKADEPAAEQKETVDLVGNRAGGRHGGRAPRADVSERTARRKRARACGGARAAGAAAVRRRKRRSDRSARRVDRRGVRRPRFFRARGGVRAAGGAVEPVRADLARGIPHRARRERVLA